MANYSAIKATVNAYIKQNGKKEITGHILNSVLNATIDSLGKEFQFGGVLTPANDPGRPDQNVAYIGAAGTYPNFDGLVIASGTIGIFMWNGDWSFATIPVGKDYDNDIQSLTHGLQELYENIQELSDDVIHLDGINEEDLSIPDGGKLQFANRAYNAQQPNGMGYVILRKNKTFAGQVTGTNTIYEIRDNFSLNTETIPAGCVLMFNGGKLIGGSVAFNNTLLLGDPKFDSVAFSGSIANGFFNVTWIANGSDIGAKVNYAQQYFTRLYIPAGDYVFATPIVVNSPELFRADGNLIYNGTLTNGGAAVTISRSGGAELTFNSVQAADGLPIDFNDNRTINFIGILIKNCRVCRISARRIIGFNEGLRSMGTGGSGGFCSYNHIHIDAIWDCNIGWRVYWANVDGSGSYSNESTLYGCRIGFSGSAVAGKSHYGIVVGPPNIDPDSYKEYPDESTNVSSSNIGLYECCIEGLNAGVKVYRIAGLRIIGCREEGSTTFLHVIYGCTDLTYIPAYQNNLKLDLTTAVFFTMARWGYEKEINIYAGNVPAIPNGFVFKRYNTIGQKYVDNAYRTQRGVIIDTSTQKSFNVFRYRPDGTRITDSSLVICYLTDDGTAEIADPTSYGTPYQSSYNAGANCFYGVGNFVVPAAIKKIFVGSDFTSVAEKLIVKSVDYVPILTDSVPLIGATADRPTNLPPGIGYYDTDISKLIYRVNNAWVDSLGAAI